MNNTCCHITVLYLCLLLEICITVSSNVLLHQSKVAYKLNSWFASMQRKADAEKVQNCVYRSLWIKVEDSGVNTHRPMGALWETHPDHEDLEPWYSSPCTRSKSAVLGPGAMQWCLCRAKGISGFVEVQCHMGTVLFGRASHWPRRPSGLLTPVGRKDTWRQRQVCGQYLLEAAQLIHCFMSIISLS